MTGTPFPKNEDHDQVRHFVGTLEVQVEAHDADEARAKMLTGDIVHITIVNDPTEVE